MNAAWFSRAYTNLGPLGGRGTLWGPRRACKVSGVVTLGGRTAPSVGKVLSALNQTRRNLLACGEDGNRYSVFLFAVILWNACLRATSTWYAYYEYQSPKFAIVVRDVGVTDPRTYPLEFLTQVIFKCVQMDDHGQFCSSINAFKDLLEL
jgi:hypothetical protein